MIISIIFLFLWLQQVQAQNPTPYGIGGIVTLDDKPVEGLKIKITNINTGESKTVETKFDLTNKQSGYFVALTGELSQSVSISASYGLLEFYNSTAIDLNNTVQWLNLSLESKQGDGVFNTYNTKAEEQTSPHYELDVIVYDKYTNRPQKKIDVFIYDNNLVFLQTKNTDDSGKASFILEKGIYNIEIKTMDKSTYKQITLSNPSSYIFYTQNDYELRIDGSNIYGNNIFIFGGLTFCLSFIIMFLYKKHGKRIPKATKKIAETPSIPPMPKNEFQDIEQRVDKLLLSVDLKKKGGG